MRLGFIFGVWRFAMRQCAGAPSRLPGKPSPTAGQTVVLENAVLVPRMMMGELQVRNITACVGDFHIFRSGAQRANFVARHGRLSRAASPSITVAAPYIQIRDALHFILRAELLLRSNWSAAEELSRSVQYGELS